MALDITKDVLILDASCLINLYASGQIESILESLSQRVTVTVYVYREEALWIRQLIKGRGIRESIHLEPLIERGLLFLTTIEGEAESNLHLHFASLIRDEGESQSGAIAVNRNWAIGIDDHKARRIISEASPDVEVVYTIEIVKHWVSERNISAETLQAALLAIRHSASYAPRRANPFRQWWLDNGGVL